MSFDLPPGCFGRLLLDADALGSRATIAIFNLSIAGFTAKPAPPGLVAGAEVSVRLWSISGRHSVTCRIRVCHIQPESAAVVFVDCDASLMRGLRRVRHEARTHWGRREDARSLSISRWRHAREALERLSDLTLHDTGTGEVPTPC